MISAHARVERAFERLAAERFDERATPYLRIGPDDDLDEVRLGKGPSGTYRLWARLASGENDTGRSGVGTMLPVELETLATENGGTRQFLRVSCEDPRPVSYTHLDVYKRQRRPRARSREVPAGSRGCRR